LANGGGQAVNGIKFTTFVIRQSLGMRRKTRVCSCVTPIQIVVPSSRPMTYPLPCGLRGTLNTLRSPIATSNESVRGT
jgi:hypothetical protein